MAQRSYWIKAYNLTGQELTQKSKELDHGIWSDNGQDTPPDVFKSAAKAEWGSESDGFATGTEGNVIFSLNGGGGQFEIYWDNPYVGSDQTWVTAPKGYTYVKDDSGGNNATLKVTLMPDLG
ncbi:hypothetical protein [Nocardia nepalensis]|uniref:hypothetical protein n=1 Tax=Nocardia nepalensis TaxID=3375448 RepID=UPI003B683EF3